MNRGILSMSEQFDEILRGITSIREQQAFMTAKQEAMHTDIVGVKDHLKTLNGRVYGLEQSKADRKDLTAIRGMFWKIILILLGGGAATGVGIKELFFK